MYTDRKKLYIISSAILAALTASLFAPSGRIIAAILLLTAAVLSFLLIKKRTARSINSLQVLMIISVIGLLYLTLYFLSGLYFGFVKTPYGINRIGIVLRFILPIAAIISASEIIRYVLCVQEDKFATVAAYIIGVLGDVLIKSSITSITSFSSFMSVLGLTLFPSLLYNLLYNYLCARYGFAPSLVYRLLTVWVFYLIPYGSAVSDSITAFANMLLPIIIFLFIDALYEKKKSYALQKPGVLTAIASHLLYGVAVLLMAGTVMLISNQFVYGSLVIATPSMTGELNQGDAIIYKEYESDRSIELGQILIFEKNGSTFVHRVVDIEIINGQTRYTTKGDANDESDSGYITDGQIIGTVEYKLPYMGKPTLWLRKLFKF